MKPAGLDLVRPPRPPARTATAYAPYRDTVWAPLRDTVGSTQGSHPTPSPPGCASWDQNPNRPHITQILHHMGRHPNILDIRGRVRCRIPLRISPDRSKPFQSQHFCSILWDNKYSISIRFEKQKNNCIFCWDVAGKLPSPGPWGPCGAFWRPWEPP